MISHHNVISNVLQITSYEAVARGRLGVDTQVALGLLPFSHIYGLTVIALTGWYRGDETVVLPKFELSSLLQAVQQHRIEQMCVVCSLLVYLLGLS